jgi:Uma2 family endonuclease
MAIKPLPTNVTPEEYLEFEEKSEVRHEYVDGIVYEMPGESLENNEIAGNIYTFLRGFARTKGCHAAIEGIKLWIPQLRRYYYPDVMVLCDPKDTDRYIFQYPCFIAEVLSPATEPTDRRERLSAYRGIETLQTYLIVDPESKAIELYQRSQNWQGVRVEQGSVQVDCLDVELRPEDIFA